MLNIGDPAPDFSGVDLQGGGTFTLSDHRGQAVVIAFNGITWCGPCIFEAPILQELWTEMGPSGIHFVMISSWDDMEAVPDALQNYGITMPVLADDDMTGDYGVETVPEVFILDHELKVHAIHSGAGPPADELKQSLRRDILFAMKWPSKEETEGCLYHTARKLGIIFLIQRFRKGKKKISGKTEKPPIKRKVNTK